jgi:hypothetical protein
VRGADPPRGTDGSAEGSAIRDGDESLATMVPASCYSCHEKNGAVDTTFVQYYPTLIEAANTKGTYKKTGE